MDYTFGLHYNEIVNRMSRPSGSQIHRSEKIQICRRLPPKSQINYSNHQYHLLITNKHHKLIILWLFEG